MALTQKNKVFADVYDGDHKKAAAIAGLSESYGRKLVQDANCKTIKQSALAVQKRIREREGTQPRPEIANRRTRQAFWTEMMEDEDTQNSDRLRASELLGKSEADFIDVVKSEHTMRLSLGAPRRAVDARTLPDVPIEQAQELEGSTENKEKPCQ